MAADDLGSLTLVAPGSVEETGMSLAFLADLILKTLHRRGEQNALDVVEAVKLPYVGVTEPVLAFLRREGYVSIPGGTGLSEQTYRYALTSRGEERANAALDRSQYVGPAPVTLAEYQEVVQRQTVTQVAFTAREVAEAYSHMVLPERVLDQLGPAINSGRSIFLYGPPGTGKTTLAEAIPALLGDGIHVPYAVDFDGEIVQVFDAQVHRALASPAAHTGQEGTGQGDYGQGSTDLYVRRDARWVRCRRPMIVAGGELTLEVLDLVYSATSRYYEAPPQMKANGGVLLLDDFGRQQVRPFDLLNRWMVPLEKRVDFLTLHSSKKVRVPFDVMIVFATNLEPRDLVDEAFLRRIRHKVHVPSPTKEEFAEVFRRVCARRGVEFDAAGLAHLVQKHYVETGREMRAVHPRDLVDQLLDIAAYHSTPAAMTPELLDLACQSYFVDM
jgi:predicted ATPase with chaperone activity